MKKLPILLAQLTLAYGASAQNQNSCVSPSTCGDTTNDTFSAATKNKLLVAAIQQEKDALVETLLKDGAQDPEGFALRAAVYQGNKDLLTTLFAHGAQDPQGLALLAAVELKKVSLAKMLLKHGSKDPEGQAFTHATWFNEVAFINLLVDYKATPVDIMKKKLAAEGIFAKAVRKGDKAFVGKLLAHEEILDIRALGGALAVAIETDFLTLSNESLTNILLGLGVKDTSGLALQAAIEKECHLTAITEAGRYALVEKLLAYGSRDDFRYALETAIKTGGAVLIEKLFPLVSNSVAAAIAEKSKRRYQADPFGYALKAAIEAGNQVLIEKFIEYGATDPRGEALLAAMEKGDEALAKRILERQ